MSSFTRRAGVGVIVASLVWAFGLAMGNPAEARRVHRQLFYSGTPFGSLAWVQNAPTRDTARRKLMVEDLSGETCIALPDAGVQWFMINHRDDELEGEVGYFSVRILYRFASGDAVPDWRSGIHLQRNGNWFGTDGRPVAKEYERDSPQIPLSPQEFVALHDPNAPDGTHNLARLEAAVGPWHMKPAVDADSSWSDRYLYGPMLKAYFTDLTDAISARLLRFTVTSSNTSSSPVLFWLDPRGASSALVRIDAPTLRYEGSRRVYEVFFDRECEDQ